MEFSNESTSAAPHVGHREVVSLQSVLHLGQYNFQLLSR
jgi:hypothetical protein